MLVETLIVSLVLSGLLAEVGVVCSIVELSLLVVVSLGLLVVELVVVGAVLTVVVEISETSHKHFTVNQLKL